MQHSASDASELHLEIPRPIGIDIAGDIEKESVFVSPWLERIVVSGDLTRARLVLRPAAPLSDVVDKASRYLDAMSKQRSGFDIKVFAETRRRDSGDYEVDVDSGLVRRGWVHDYGKGQVAYNGPVLALARLIDRKAAELYSREFDVADAHFPSLVDAETLHKCGYFDSHPNAVTFIGNMIEDIDALEAFRRANSCSQGALLPAREDIHMDGMCLNPAACFPCYPTLTGRNVGAGEVHSWLGRVFRYESRNINGLARLYEFNVRELVFVGDENYVRDCRKKALKAVEELASFFDLDARVQTATDPFFATVAAAKKFWQASQEVKNEVIIPVLDAQGRSKSLACGSINLHGNFFGTRFSIADGAAAPAQTGCVGLGIERWVLACFTQHGFDARRWPEAVARTIFR
jgi:seryl-tRNA synthetase